MVGTLVPNTPSRVYGEPVFFDIFSMQDYLDKNGVSLITGENVRHEVYGVGCIMGRIGPGRVRVSYGTCSRRLLTRDLERV
jgi:hypothetical protein